MRRLLPLALALLACTATPPPAEDAAVDVPEEEFTLCARPCAAGTVCRGFRCVAIAGMDASADDGAFVDVSRLDSTPPTVACCPIDPTPHCGCVRAGGARRADGTCRTVCGQGYPELWFRRTDPDNCMAWSASGLRCPGDDAGVDAR
jgi:hypothetical protein